jgi:nitroimidazol reductase NimA-like FMN-containing flavoprotein (pyridoxamine 5'-phosphate oxidase superfamily)
LAILALGGAELEDCLMSDGAHSGTVQELDEAECLRLVAGQEIGRIAYNGPAGPMVLPVNYRLFEGSVVFRTAQGSAMDEDLTTGIQDAEYLIAFEIDELYPARREGWTVLIHGSAHHVTDEDEELDVAEAGVIPWVSSVRDLYMRIRPTHIAGRRISHPG